MSRQTTVSAENPRETPTARACIECGRPLAPSARSSRLYCSSPCRWQHWAKENGKRAEFVRPPVPLHYHAGIGATMKTVLVGDESAGYHRGDGCPAECGGAQMVYSIGIAAGHENAKPPTWDRRPRRLTIVDNSA